MFFSSNDLYKACVDGDFSCRYVLADYFGTTTQANFSRRQVSKYVRASKAAIVERRTTMSPEGTHYESLYIGKWLRPWHVVPSLKSFSAPEGEFAVGVEVEMGFRSRDAARSVARQVQHWKHIALDYEGGTYPIEATFPPVLYSKYGSASQPSRYLKLLKRLNVVQPHADNALIGTHVNVSKGGQRPDSERGPTLRDALCFLSASDNRKYFGRSAPYGYNYNQDTYTEFKMFNSTTDWKRLRQYVDVAVALADLLYSDRPINHESVVEALEIGYNKRNRKVSA